MIPTPYQFNTVKVVVFVELEPLSDKYQQICLTEEQIKEVMNTIHDQHSNSEEFELTLNDKHQYTFANIKDAYTQEEINVLASQDT
jgi:hypothetical protein